PVAADKAAGHDEVRLTHAERGCGHGRGKRKRPRWRTHRGRSQFHTHLLDQPARLPVVIIRRIHRNTRVCSRAARIWWIEAVLAPAARGTLRESSGLMNLAGWSWSSGRWSSGCGGSTGPGTLPGQAAGEAVRRWLGPGVAEDEGPSPGEVCHIRMP